MYKEFIVQHACCNQEREQPGQLVFFTLPFLQQQALD